MKKHNLNDFAAAVAHGADNVAYNMNTGELYTNISFSRVGQFLHRSADDDFAVIKSRVAELIKLDYIEAMHEDVFIVCEFFNTEGEARTLWSLALVHPETDGN